MTSVTPRRLQRCTRPATPLSPSKGRLRLWLCGLWITDPYRPHAIGASGDSHEQEASRTAMAQRQWSLQLMSLRRSGSAPRTAQRASPSMDTATANGCSQHVGRTAASVSGAFEQETIACSLQCLATALELAQDSWQDHRQPKGNPRLRSKEWKP